MNTMSINRTGAVLMAGVAAIHLVLAPEYFGEQAYVGVLFLLGAAGGALVAARLWLAPDRPTWTLGALMSLAMAAGFVLSRTLGLPGFHESEWELSGLLSLALEGGFVAAAAAATTELVSA
jgi:hypothetical protein